MYDTTYYTLAPGAIGGIICRDGGSKYFYHYDRLGNVVGITDASGNVVRVYHNTAFGVWWSYDSDGYDQEVSDVQPYHLTSKEYDADVGLFYFHARWYARWPGRFISRDPFRLIDKVALFAGCEEGRFFMYDYALAGNNPVEYADVTGLSPAATWRTSDEATIGSKCQEYALYYRKLFPPSHFMQACYRTCETNCCQISAGSAFGPGAYLQQCFEGCRKGQDCAKALLGYGLCLAKARTPKAIAKCQKKLGPCIKFKPM